MNDAVVTVMNYIFTDNPILALEEVQKYDGDFFRIVEDKLRHKLRHIYNWEEYKRKYRDDPMYWRPKDAWNERFAWVFSSITGSYLDLGCYEGSLVKRVSSELGVRAVGVEICKAAVDWNNKSGHGEFIQSSIEDFETEERFDTISCLEVIEHVPDDKVVINKIVSLLKPGGVGLITTPYLYHRNTPNMLRTWEMPDEYFDHVRSYGVDALREILPPGSEIFEKDKVLYAIFKNESKTDTVAD